MLNQITKYSFLVDFKTEVANSLPHEVEKIALLVSPEYEGYYKNGGIGTYYNALSQRLKAEGWYVILLLCATEDRFQGKSKVSALDRVFSTIEVEEILTLQPVHRAILAEAKSDFFDYQSFCILFFIQALTACCPAATIYAEFGEMYGYRTIQAKQVGLIPQCVTSVTLHSGHEWIDEANEKFTVPYPQDYWQLCHYEQNSFENADLCFHPSNFIRDKVESYGWNVDRAIRLPYFVPTIELALARNSTQSQLIQSKLIDNKIPLIFFGRLEERKGLCTFIQSLKSLKRELVDRFHLIFLGKVIPLQSYSLKHLDSQQYIEQELKEYCSYNICENLFSAEALNLISKLKHAIVCLTSPQDNFPNSALEVGQLPVNIIAADTGGFRETLGLLERSDGVHWFQAGNARSLTNVLDDLLSKDPEIPDVPTAEFLATLNQSLLAKRMAYIDRVPTRTPTELSPAVTIGVFCNDGDSTLLESLASLHQQTYQQYQIIVIAIAIETSEIQQLLITAQKQFPNIQIVHCERVTGAIDIDKLLTSIRQSNWLLFWRASDIASTEMLDTLFRSATNADAPIALCPPPIDTYLHQVSNQRIGFVSQLLAVNAKTTPNLLVETNLLNRIDWSLNFDIANLTKYLGAIAITSGVKMAYFPYPLAWTSKNPQLENKDSILRELFQMRQYINSVEPLNWNVRQLYILKTSIQQLAINTGNIGKQVSGSSFKSLAGYSVVTLVKASAWKVAKKSYSRIAKYENIGAISSIKRKLVKFFAEKNL